MSSHTVRREAGSSLASVLPDPLEDDLKTADVFLILKDNSIIPAHKCFLSASPLLKSIFTSLESRIDKLPHISLAEFDKEAVICLVKFLYKGFVVLRKKSPAEKQFFSLCKALRFNPPVDTDRSLPCTPVSSPEPAVRSEDLPLSVANPQDGDVANPEIDANSNLLHVQSTNVPEEVNEDTACNSVEVPNSTSFHDEGRERLEDSLQVDKNDENNEWVGSINSVTPRSVPEEPPQPPFENHVSLEATTSLPKNNGKVEGSEVSSEKTKKEQSLEATTSIQVRLENNDDKSTEIATSGQSVQKTSEEDESKETISTNLDSPENSTTEQSSEIPSPNALMQELLSHEERLEDPPDLEINDPEWNYDQESDYETTEHISDYLNLLNSQDNFGQASSEAKPCESDADTFKMPDSFDLPQDYIKEIVPYSHSVGEPLASPNNPSYCISEDELVIVTVGDKTIKGTSKEKEKVNDHLESKVETSRTVSVDETTKDKKHVYGEVEQITWRKEENSIRYKDKNKERKSRMHNPKKDRKLMNSSLFGSDSEEDKRLKTQNKQESLESKEKSGISSRSDDERTPTPTTSLKDDLEEKRERMRKKLKRSGEVENVNVIEYKMNKKKRQRQSSLESGRGSSAGANASQKKNHICNSSCPCVKKLRHDLDDNFIVSDNHESTSSTDSDEDVTRSSGKLKKKSHIKKSSKPQPEEKANNDESDEESETTEERRRRLDDRKARKGGDILAWMNKRASVKVNVQVLPKDVILDKAMYKLQLLAEEESPESEAEATELKRPPSDIDSDESIPRGRRIKPLKESSDDSPDEMRKERKKKSKKKIKKKKKEKRKAVASESPEELLDVVWTPEMYRNWDKKRTKYRDSDSDKDKGKKHYKRSLSQPSPSLNKISPQKSYPGLESLTGSVKSFIPSTTPMASLPKIPKLKKSE